MTKSITPALPEALLPQDRPSEDRLQRQARSRQRQLGRALERLYASVTTEPVPDEFMQLLEKIDARKTDRETM